MIGRADRVFRGCNRRDRVLAYDNPRKAQAWTEDWKEVEGVGHINNALPAVDRGGNGIGPSIGSENRQACASSVRLPRLEHSRGELWNTVQSSRLTGGGRCSIARCFPCEINVSLKSKAFDPS